MWQARAARTLFFYGGLLVLTFCSTALYAPNAARQFNTGISPSELTTLYLEPIMVGCGAGIIALVLIWAFWRLFLYWVGKSDGTHHRQTLMRWSLFGLPLLAALVAAAIVIGQFPEPYLPAFFLSTR